MKHLSILALVAFSLCFQAFSSNEVNTAKKTVDQFYKKQDFNRSKHFPPQCRPQGSCLETACDNLGTFECDDSDEIQQVRRTCRGIYGDTCLRKSFRYLSRIDYNDLEEMLQLVNSCRGVYDFECLDFTCDRLGNINCNDLEEIVEINQQCGGQY